MPSTDYDQSLLNAAHATPVFQILLLQAFHRSMLCDAKQDFSIEK